MLALSGNRTRAFTLIEIIVVLGALGLLGGLIAGTLTRQQRLYRIAGETLEVRRSVRDAISVLAEEIRSASSRDTIRLMSDSAIELFTNIGSSVACTKLAPSDIGIAPPNPSGLALTSWLVSPDTGDLAIVFQPASSTAGTWSRYRIRSVSSRATSSACPASTGLGGGGAAASSYVLTLSPAPAAFSAGQPVRFMRRGRYSLYRSSDGKWYLGYRRCNAIGNSSCGTIQPLSGYYQAYSPDSARTGILFRYFDAADRSVSASSDATAITRVEIVARAVSFEPVTLDGTAVARGDSIVLSVAIRNER